MKPRTRTCKAIGCQHVIGQKLMCLDHWRMVPAPLRREILELLKLSRRDGPFAVTAAGEHVDEKYADAVARAVTAVQEKQERKVAAIAGPSGSLFT